MFLANLYLPLRDLLLLFCTFFSSSLLLLFFFSPPSHTSRRSRCYYRVRIGRVRHTIKTLRTRAPKLHRLLPSGATGLPIEKIIKGRIRLGHRPHRASTHHTTRSWVQIKFLTVLGTARSALDFDVVRGGEISDFKFRENLCRRQRDSRLCEQCRNIFNWRFRPFAATIRG